MHAGGKSGILETHKEMVFGSDVEDCKYLQCEVLWQFFVNFTASDL